MNSKIQPVSLLNTRRVVLTGVILACFSLCASAQGSDRLGDYSARSMGEGVSIETNTLPTYNLPVVEKFRPSAGEQGNYSSTVFLPDKATLESVYWALNLNGYIDAHHVSPEPDDETLIQAYQYAVDSSLIAPGDSPLMEQLHSLPKFTLAFDPTRTSFPDFGVQSKSKKSCVNALLACAGETIITTAGCTAAAETAGLLAGECFAAIAGTSLACAGGVALECDRNDSRDLVSVGRRGGTPVPNDTKTELFCTGDHRVNKVEVWAKPFSDFGNGEKISAIQLRCSKSGLSGGNILSFVRNSQNATQYKSATCGTNPWNLVQGFRIRAGSAIDGMSVFCDRVFDTTAGDWESPFVGSSGGTSAINRCAEGSYLVGLRTWHNSSKYVKALEVMCGHNRI